MTTKTIKTIKTINSTQAQNNFGSLLENGTQYLVQRFGRDKQKKSSSDFTN